MPGTSPCSMWKHRCHPPAIPQWCCRNRFHFLYPSRFKQIYPNHTLQSGTLKHSMQCSWFHFIWPSNVISNDTKLVLNNNGSLVIDTKIRDQYSQSATSRCWGLPPRDPTSRASSQPNHISSRLSLPTTQPQAASEDLTYSSSKKSLWLCLWREQWNLVLPVPFLFLKKSSPSLPLDPSFSDLSSWSRKWRKPCWRGKWDESRVSSRTMKHSSKLKDWRMTHDPTGSSLSFSSKCILCVSMNTKNFLSFVRLLCTERHL